MSTLKNSVEQLQRKAEILQDLDAKTINATQDWKEKFSKSEEIQDTIMEKIGQMNYFQMDIRVNTQVIHSLNTSVRPF